MKNRAFLSLLLFAHLLIGGYSVFWTLRNVAVIDGTTNWFLSGDPVIYLTEKNKFMKLLFVGGGSILVFQALLVFLFARDRFAQALVKGHLLKRIISALVPGIVLLNP